MTVLFLGLRLIDWIGAEVTKVDFFPKTTGSVSETPICQNLTDLSLDAEIKVEGDENIRFDMLPACLINGSMG